MLFYKNMPGKELDRIKLSGKTESEFDDVITHLGDEEDREFVTTEGDIIKDLQGQEEAELAAILKQIAGQR